MFLIRISFGFVFGVVRELTYMKEYTLKEQKLGKAIRSDLALPGWLGFIIGIILNECWI